MRSLILITGLLTTAHLPAEVRTWTSADGRAIEAEFLRSQGNAVVLKLKDGREVPVELAKLSAADRDFVKTQGAGVPAAAGSPSGKKGPKFNELVLDKKAWVMRPKPETFGITGIPLTQQLETPHFLFTAGPKMKPAIMESYAEACERLYAQMVRDLTGLAPKFQDRKVCVWLASDDREHALMGRSLSRIDADLDPWTEHSIAWARFPQEVADSGKVFRNTRGFNTGQEPGLQRKLLWPERIHFMASTILPCYGHSFRSEGRGFEMFNLSYSYFMECEITGKVETKVVFSESPESVEGFKNPRGWPGAVKRILGNTPLKPSLERFLTLDSSKAEPMDVGSGFGLMQFIFRNPVRLAALNKLLEKARESKAPPTAAEFATAMGAASVEAFDQQWVDFLKSGEFQ